METESLSDLFRRLDARNRENVALAGLGIRTSADIFEAIQSQYEHSRSQRNEAYGGSVVSPALVDLGIRTSADILEALNEENGQKSGDMSSRRRHRLHRKPGIMSSGQGQVVDSAEGTVENGPQEEPRHRSELKRSGPRSDDGQLPHKRPRTVERQERSESEQVQDLANVLGVLEEDFAEKERLSDDQTWCTPVSHERKAKTVEEFYKAFHDMRTLPVLTCMFCYRKHSRAELQYVDWDWWVANTIEKRDGSPFKCVQCFPVGQKILGRADCVRHLGRGALSAAARLHTQLGCEDMFPDELKDLTPVEEKLIALNSCYGFITKYSRPDGHRQSARYPKHIKGHITVFPSSVQELAENVLPHPLLKVLNEIHVSWQGSKKPVPSDLSALLSVRRRVVEKALLWLKRHNPLYAEININTAELRSWDSPPHGVPSQIYDRLERNEPSAQEKSQTGQLVPPTERGLDDEGRVDIREVLATLGQGNDWEASHEVLAEPSNEDGDAAVGMVHEISSSGMFALDGGPNVAESEKLRYVGDALNGQDPHDKAGGSVLTGSAEVRQGHTSEPYILVSRGEDFADSFDPRFFAKTFPTLLPLGDGGPRQAEESIDNGVLEENRNVEADIRVGGLISSRNMTLETWAKVVLQRHGGRFATHHIFSFLVFNMGVRSRNRRVSMLSVTRKNFPEVQRIVRSLTAERLQLAKAELETVGRTDDEDVKQLLKSLSLYGFRQPMSRESRLSMRRKIKSDIIRDGIPAIWFTLNPNDITNPVKLKLAAYRKRDPDEAEAFLTSLDLAYKRTRLAISDPLSSAIFFHREVTMFFNHYVNTGKESVFGRISRYFGAVETNERGSLHMHGLLWLHGNMHLTSILRDVEGEDKAAYRERIIQYVDSVFTEDLDQEASSAVQAERSVTSDISLLLENRQQFAAAFDEEANFCAGATQIHTHSPTCVKYAIRGRGKRRDPCRFKAPWRLAERTAFTDEGVLQIRRTHSMVNRWNKAMAVGLRHNHDVSFIATQCKTLAIVFYVTNYATKVEDPVWKRVAAAAGLFPDTDEPIVDHSQAGNVDRGQNQTRHFLMKVANRIFTERALSQVEVVAHLLGYPTEFASNDAWAFLNVSSLYWHIFRLWRHLRRESGMEVADEPLEETVFLEEGGERISPVQAYPHRGKLLEGLSLYDYMSIVKLKRKGKGAGTRGEVQLDRSWHPSQIWVQALRKPGEHAVVCFDGYLSTDWSEVTEGYYKRAAVQHLALFVPWESFLSEGAGDINAIWEGQRRALPRRILFVVDNIQLLHRSAEDAKRDANQWAAQSEGGGGDVDISVDTAGLECDTEPQAAYRSDGVGTATRVLDVLRQAMARTEITAGSKEIWTIAQQLSRFQQSALRSADELHSTIVSERGLTTLSRAERSSSEAAEMPWQEHVKSIKSQQTSASREKEKMIQGIQNQPDSDTAGHESAVCNMQSGFGEHEVRHTATDSETIGRCVRPSTTIEFGSSTSFSEAGRQLSRSFTLNRKQGIAVQLICRQLDHVHRDESGTPQLCQFIGGEGGTGKSRVISTITELFASKGISHRLLVTATSGTAAANIDGITIHSACGFSKDTAPRGGRGSDVDGFAASSSASFRVDGRSTAQWQEKWLLIIDEVSMLGARTLYAVNEQLRKLRGRAQDFGGIPIVVFCGDFHQFRPVQERSILLPSAAISWNEEKSFKAEQRYQHDRAHALWKKFTTVIMLDEQVRAASDPQLQRLLTRVRRGVQNRSDMDLLNRTCYREKRRIVWAPGLTVVTPLNRNRWNLNIEASLCFRKNRQSLLRIFVSEHRWKEGEPTEEEAVMMLGQGDDSAVPVPAIFMFVPGMPVVVNKNTHQGLKLVNGASYTALDIIVDKAHPGHRVNEETVLHFGPPAGIVLASETTRDFHFVGMPAGTVLLTPISTMIECQKKRPWQRKNVSRRGLPCAAAFACTDYKVQSKTLNRVVLELRGARTTNIDGEAVPAQCDPYSLYVQLSRCRTLRGITLLSEVRERDFVGNRVPENMVAAEEKLERLSDKTIRDAACWDWSEQN
ncbi:ATP-dependent DNA helicase PIF1 [Fusarium oxysporum f. sp. conglutinans]|nr:ATP-dependent DNA helicase PIF1 [Fusarium oxysporum f. sp. conglutinans]